MVNMNMIVNSSDLVGYEAETTKNTKIELGNAQALNKLMKIWEGRQARSGKKVTGLGLLAITLAACNSDDDTPFAQSDIDTAVAAVDTTLDDAAAVTAALSPHATLAAAVTSNDTTVTTAATTAALTAADGTIYATVDAAKTAGVNTTSADAVTAALTSSDGTVHATVDAAITSNDAAITTATTTTATAAAETTLMAGTGFASVSALLSAYSNATASVTPTTATLTTAGDTVNGTANNDTITGTGLTYTTGDLVVDASSVDADVMNVTFTADSEALPTIAGIETINFSLNALATAATGGIPQDAATTFGMDLNGIAGGNIVMSVSKAASTVVGIAVENVSTNTTLTTDLVATAVAVEANADVTLQLTGAATNTLTLQSGTGDDFTLVGSGTSLIVTDIDAEENISITNAGGGVTINDLTAATDTLSTLTVVAGGLITLTDSQNIGSVDLSTTAGGVTITDTDATTTINATTDNGNVLVTAAATAVTSVTAVAVGDNDTNVTGADGTIVVTDARLAETLTLTSSAGQNIDNINAAGTLVLTAGAASTISRDASDVETITISSTSTAATPVTFTSEDGDGTSNGTNDGLVELDNLNFTGSNSVTFLMPGADLLLIQAEDTDAGTLDTAAGLIVSDTAMTGGTSRFEIDATAGTNALNTRSMVVDEIAIGYTVNANESFLVTTGQKFVITGDTTADIALTGLAVPGNSITVEYGDDAVATSGNDTGGITTTNIATLNLVGSDASNTTGGGTVTGVLNVGTANTIIATGSTPLTIAGITAGTFNASAYTGALIIPVISQAADFAAITGGTAGDTFTSDADESFSVNGGGGLDTLVLGASDYSNNTVTITSIETLDITASGVSLSGTVMHNSTAVITGNAATDTLGILATVSTGETINISNTATTGVVSITGLAGADNLTGSATTSTTFTGAANSDTIVGGSAADIVNVLFETNAADGITLGGGSDSVVVDNASNAGTVQSVLITDFNAGTVATIVDTITIDASVINSMTTVTALSDSNSVATNGANSVVLILTADNTAIGNTTDVVVLSQDYATDALALAGMATAGADTFTAGGFADNDGFMVVYFDGTNTNLAIATSGATGTSSDDFDSLATIFVLGGADYTAILNTGDIIGAT